MATAAQLRVLRWLAAHPGADVFDYYEAVGGFTRGLRTVSRRGGAGRVHWRLVDAGLLEGAKHAPTLTAAGREAIRAT